MGWSLGLVGLLECLEAAIAKEPRDFFPHLQNGIPDVVVGALITLGLGGGISVLLGFLIWVGWPSAAAWFLAFCLGAEIGLRGWSLMQLGHWLKARPRDS